MVTMPHNYLTIVDNLIRSTCSPMKPKYQRRPQEQLIAELDKFYPQERPEPKLGTKVATDIILPTQTILPNQTITQLTTTELSTEVAAVFHVAASQIAYSPVAASQIAVAAFRIASSQVAFSQVTATSKAFRWEEFFRRRGGVTVDQCWFPAGYQDEVLQKEGQRDGHP